MTAGPALNRVPVICNWVVDSISGWGIYGLNLAQRWANDPELSVVFSRVSTHSLFLDPLRKALLSDVIKESAELEKTLTSGNRSQITLKGITIHAIGNGLGAIFTTGAERIHADAQLAAAFFEDTAIDEKARAYAAYFELILAGSTWNRDILEGNGIGPVRLVLQGIDPTLFHPAPRSGLFGDRFLVFSGGKLEPRKGQDLVLMAFKRFAVRHPEALLVTAWQSPWPQFSSGIGSQYGLVPVRFQERGPIEVVRWAVENGVKETQIFDIGLAPNWLMPTILREADAALFMNRCEGGTNLVAMECMACGVPTILSANTGHLDLLRDQSARALMRQTRPRIPSGYRGIEGWGESDIEEAVDALEDIYADRAAAAETGKRGATLLAGMTWARQAALLKEAIRPFLGRVVG